MKDAATIASVRSYDDLIAVLRARQAELELTDAGVDQAAGFQIGYWGKLVGEAQVKKLGPMSFGVALEVLGIELMATRTAPRISAQVQKRIRPRSTAKRLSIRAVQRLIPAMFTRLGRKGGKARVRTTTARRRSEIAAKGGRAKWRKFRAHRRESDARRQAQAQQKSGAAPNGDQNA